MLQGIARVSQELRLCPRSHAHREDQGNAQHATEHVDVVIDQILFEEFRRSHLVAMVSFGLVLVVCLVRSEEHTSELQSLMRISYAVFCLKKKNKKQEDS